MKDFKFECLHCEQRLQATEELAGRQFQCPTCDYLIRAPVRTHPINRLDTLRPHPIDGSPL